MEEHASSHPSPTPAEPATPRRLPTVPLIIAGTVVLIIGLFIGLAVLLDRHFQTTIVPRVAVGGVAVGNRTPELASILVSQAFDQLTKNGIPVSKDGAVHQLDVLNLSPDDPDLSRPLVLLDADASIAAARLVARQGSLPIRVVATLKSMLLGTDLPFVVAIDTATINQSLLDLPGTAPETPVVSADLVPTDDTPVRFQVSPAQTGATYNTALATDAIATMLASGAIDTIQLTNETVSPDVVEADVRALIPSAEALMDRESLLVIGPDKKTWTLTPRQLADWLTVERDAEGTHLTVTEASAETFLNQVKADIDVPAQNARFQIENNRVVEFQPAVDGITLDVGRTREHLATAVLSKATSTEVIRTVDPAEVTTESANSLGIREKLGTGESNYAGSPGNRIKNIRNAVRKLNGILIQPGETFSLINALQPFTIEGGYLPELVIKGDKITPEIGGGACQIGTTTFRAAMNSGLEIVERRNHSLVVRYYNDLSNNNPGTDATIYDPSPDFKFLNDTGSIVLFEAIMDETKKRLYFSFWGTSDGRNGSYSPPKLLRWIGAGPEKIVETTNLPPGKRECQEAHPGADTTFTYTVVLPTGEKKEVVFDSHYRALPRICLVGVATPSVLGETAPVLDAGAAADAGAPAQ